MVAIAPANRPPQEITVTWTDPPAAGRTIVVTVVRAPACHLCEDAADALGEFGRKFPIRVQQVEAGASDGAALVRQHRPPMFPLVLLDGAFFSSGRLPRRKLAKALADRTAAVGA